MQHEDTMSKRTKAETKARHEFEAGGGAAGAIVGAAFGSVAGPPGIAAGAVIGAIAGAIVGAATEDNSLSRAAEEKKLDREIGVSGGELGAPNLKHPPATIGAFSAASSSSAGTQEPTAAEGPLQAPED